jgi:hypothetical protein
MKLEPAQVLNSTLDHYISGYSFRFKGVDWICHNWTK